MATAKHPHLPKANRLVTKIPAASGNSVAVGKVEIVQVVRVEAQRTIKRAELAAFFCFLRRIVGPTTGHVDKGVIGGLWIGEMQCIGPRREGC